MGVRSVTNLWGGPQIARFISVPYCVVGDPAEQQRADTLDQLQLVLAQLVIDQQPVHLVIRTGDEPVERDPHRHDDLSHLNSPAMVDPVDAHRPVSGWNGRISVVDSQRRRVIGRSPGVRPWCRLSGLWVLPILLGVRVR